MGVWGRELGPLVPPPESFNRRFPAKNRVLVSLIDVRIIRQAYDIRVIDHCEVGRTTLLIAAMPRWEPFGNNLIISTFELA